jgi:transcriptional regulator with XRE-family HTH domain
MTGQEFRELRKRIGLSQERLAERLARSRVYVYHLECNPEPDRMAVLALKQIAQEVRASIPA